MPNAIMNALMMQYEARQAENAREEERRLKEAAGLCPEIGCLAAARRDALFSSVRSALASGKQNASVSRLAEDMENYNLKIRGLLKKNGLPEDYLQPVYQCEICHDTGFVGESVKKRCSCLNKEYFKQMGKLIGLNERVPQTFEAFREEVFSREIIPGANVSQRTFMCFLRDKCKKYAETFPDTATPDMLFMGTSGLGKTFLMQAIAHRVLERGFSALCVSAFKVVEMTRQSYFNNNAEESSPLFEADLLLIDDLGTEPLMDNVTITQLYHVINERQNAGKHTILSTNLNSVQFQDRYTERISSRLLSSAGQCELIAFIGADIRRKV
jgi:DNA replication protein DnaC